MDRKYYLNFFGIDMDKQKLKIVWGSQKVLSELL